MKNRKMPAATLPVRPGAQSAISAKAHSAWNPDVQAAAGDDEKATISILDPIGEGMFSDGVTAKRIGAALRAIDGDDVVVNINSPGGDFFEGLAIYNLLREYSGHVTVRVLGMAASAASVIAMAADRIEIGRAAFLMVHNTWVMAAGDQHAFREVADWLAPFDLAAVGIYAARTGSTVPSITAMLDAETWIGGEDAVKRGFADALLDSDDINNSARNAADVSPMAAEKKLDLALAAGLRLSRSERRALVAALKGGGTPGAASNGTPGAVEIEAFASAALSKLKSI